MSIDVLYLEPDVYLKLDLGELAAMLDMQKYNGKWMHGERGKLTGSEFDAMAEGTDVTGADAILAAAADVRQTAPGTFAGTVDLTKATDAVFVDEDQNMALGTQATTVPFTVVLDADRRRAGGRRVPGAAAGDEGLGLRVGHAAVQADRHDRRNG